MWGMCAALGSILLQRLAVNGIGYISTGHSPFATLFFDAGIAQVYITKFH